MSRRTKLNNQREQSYFGFGSLLPQSEEESAEHRRLDEAERQLTERIRAIAGHVFFLSRDQRQDLIKGDTPLHTTSLNAVHKIQNELKQHFDIKPTYAEDAAWREAQAEQHRRREQEAQAEVAKAEREEAKKRKREADRAALASVLGKAREHAEGVKRSLARDHQCPYCGDDLGDQPHADHVYPISKGGRSVAVNMVYVCAACNIKKGDMTLAAFVATYRLDRDAIESRLRQLGKEY